MQKITFKPIEQRPEELKVRNNWEALIADIVNATSVRDKKELAKLIAISAKTQGWGESELHALLQKRNDPTIRNYTAFVRWSIKTK